MGRIPLFPDTTRIDNNILSIANCDLAALAKEYGTPLYLYDQATLENSVDGYLDALSASYPGKSGLIYAGKAFLCLALAEWMQQNGLWVDCSGLGEIAIAFAAGVLRENIIVHGVNKSSADLEAAVERAGTLVVDNPTEFQRLGEIVRLRTWPDLWLRFRPEVDVETHTHIQTGQEDSKFGMTAQEIVQVARLCKAGGLPLKGLHFHLGSQFHDPTPIGQAIQKTLDLVKAIDLGEGWTLSPGGGWGVAYHEDELPHPDVRAYVRFVAETVKAGCHARGLPLPCLQLEPGRSLIARAGVAVYSVGTVKRSAHRTWILLDGGMADNPRPALYGARYSAVPVHGLGQPAEGPAWMAGPYCESGDVLLGGLSFPEVQEGDLVAVPVSGAYQLSMSSNYNGARRPAVVWLSNGRAQLIQAREIPEDLYRRDRRLVK